MQSGPTPLPSTERRGSSARSRRLVWLLSLCVLPVCVGCPSKESLGAGAMGVVGPGVVNNPANKSLRFDLLKFGLERFCEEMRHRGVPLKLADDQPVAGRFFADSCQSQVLDQEARKSFVVQYSGTGYGWTNVTGRIGFRAAGLLEYAPDFQLQDEAMYIYFRPRNVSSLQFETLMVESAVAQAGMAVTNVNPDELGRNIVRSQLERGFTVIRYDESGETDFGMGFIDKGNRPFRPFTIQHSEKRSLVNDRTEIHSQQQDYIGEFVVADDDLALSITLKLDGSPTIDVFLVPATMGKGMIRNYITQPGAVPLGGAPRLGAVVTQGQLYRQTVAVGPGSYYLLVDHSNRAGQSAPPGVPADSPATLDYLVQLGEAE